MRKKKVATIDPELLILSDEYMRRAAREHGLRFKPGKRVETLALLYNMLAVDLFKEYADFVAMIERNKAKK